MAGLAQYFFYFAHLGGLLQCWLSFYDYGMWLDWYNLGFKWNVTWLTSFGFLLWDMVGFSCDYGIERSFKHSFFSTQDFFYLAWLGGLIKH